MSHHFTSFTRKTFGIIFVAALLTLALTLSTHARDVPLTSGHIIDGNFMGVSDIATADLDGDGDLDVLGAADNANDIAWWENTAGDGSAWSKQIVDGSFDRASAVAAADLDGDGDMDILGASFGANDIAWWENTAGDGSTWSQRAVDSSFFAAWDVVAADVDGDGDMDVLGVGFEQSNIAWWENADRAGPGTGDGSVWSKHSVTTDTYLAYGIATADVDGDGDVDVLGASGSHEEIVWWENTAGDGSAWSKHTVELSYDTAYVVAAADVDGDGDQDILGGLGGGRMTWWENTAGNGSVWSKHTVNDSYYDLWDVAAADVDGDGDMDLLGAAWTNQVEIAWFENTAGDGSTWSRHSMVANHGGWNSVAAADVDGDGDVDILGAAHDDSDITWWENETIHRSALYPTAGKMVVDAGFDGAESIAAADIDGDGDLDILGAGGIYDTIAWWENVDLAGPGTGDGSAWSKQIVDEHFGGAACVAAADIDGDGDLDILGAAFNATNDITWWENTVGDGSAWSEHSVVAHISGANSVAAADVDGDGDLDVLGVSLDGNEVAWWENTAGDGSAWSKHVVDGYFEQALDIAAADVDGDGDLDILGAGYTGDIAWWENTTGDGSAWSKHLVDDSFDGADSVVVADVDGDGDPDFLGAAFLAGDIAWWENTAGDGSAWSKHIVTADFYDAQSVAAADLDGDGDLDVLSTSFGDGEIAWWENTDGDSSVWSEHTVDGSFDGAYDVAAADVDGDGDPDVLGAAQDAGEIAWWENGGGQFALATADTGPTQLSSGQTDDLLKITMTHRGRSGDGDEELVTLELLFEESDSDPLTSAEANAVIGKLYIYLDDGSGGFEIGSDTLVATVDSLALDNGVQTVAFADGDANVQVQFGTERAYFVVVELAGDAYTQTAIDRFQVTHVTESSSTADDRDHDIPLILEYAADFTSSNVLVPIARVWDGGGATEDWSEAANWVDDTLPIDSCDGVYFDDTSPKNAVVDADFDRIPAGVIITSGYTGQISQDADLTVSGDWNQEYGTFIGGSSTLDIGGAFNLTGGTFTAPSGLMSVGGGFHHSGGTFDPNGGRVVLDNTSDQILATTFNDLVLNDGLLGYWKLDEGTGTTAADSSGYGHDGVLHNSPAWSTDTPATMDFADSYTLGFDRTGSAEYVAMSDTPLIDDAQELTLSTWVRLASTPTGSGYSDMRFITLGHEKAVLRYVDESGAGKLQFYMSIGGSLHSIVVEYAWATDTWYHVAGTYDGSTMGLYLDGAEVDTKTISGPVDAGDGLVLSHSADDAALDGLLDDVRVYNRALSADEINDLADGRHPETSIATTTLGAALDVNGDLTLNSGTLDISASNYTITVAGDFVRNGGVFEAGGGMVTFDGTGTQTLDTDVITFHDLKVEEGATLDLGSATALQVDGALANNGGLKQSKEVDGSNTAFLHIKDGSGTQDRYFGLEIDPGTGDMGSTAVTVWGNQLCPNARAGVLRCFELDPTTPQAATVRFYYTEAERNGQENATMDVYHRNETRRKWEQEGGSYERGGSGDGQYVQVSDVDGYSPFALSDSRLHEWIGHWLYLPLVAITQPASVSAGGKVLTVGPGQEYETIQSAVDDANPGDTILVYPGFYEESVLVTTDRLEIIAQGEGVTVFSSDWATAAFTVYADYVTIHGFDELAGKFLNCIPGIEFEGSFNTFTDNVINPGSCPGVNALVCRDPDGGSNFNRIENNTIVHGDLGIVMTSTSAEALNVGNIIRNNTINGIGMTGIAVENGRSFTISGNTIPGSGFGHCITVAADNNMLQGGHRITNNQVWNCKAYGIALWADDHTSFTNNLISGNEVSFSLHGINMYADPDATLIQNLIRDNTVYHNLEAGIVLEAGSEKNLIMENLVETNHGIGIVILSDSNTVVRNDVLDNATDGINVEGNFNTIFGNTSLDNDGWDLADYGQHNRWLFNEYGTSSWEAEVGWVVGQGPGDGYGTIINTTDGGENWVRQGSPGEIPDTPLTGVSAIDGCSAWVAGGISDDFGVILRTTDGGKSWVRQGAAGQIPDLSTAAVYAVNKHIAWVVGQNGLILHTIDGGRTWIRQAQDTAPGYNLEGVYASDPWNVWAVGGKNQKPCPDDICGIILHSSNGGWTWEQQTFTPSDGNLGGYLITVHGLNAKNVWAVGNASVQHTTDGGETWQNVTPLNGGGFYDWNGVFAVNENNVWVARDNDGIYQYDGDTWNTFSPPPPTGSGGFHLVRVSAVDPQRVWIAGPSFLEPDKGIILHTDDGGETWEQQDPGFEAGFWGVSFVKSAVCNP